MRPRTPSPGLVVVVHTGGRFSAASARAVGSAVLKGLLDSTANSSETVVVVRDRGQLHARAMVFHVEAREWGPSVSG